MVDTCFWLTTKRVRADIEEAFAKLRYNRIYEAEESEDGESVEQTEEEKLRFEIIEAMQDEVYCPDSNKIDMGNRRVTDIKVNKRVMLPAPIQTGEEAILMVRRERLLQAAQ